jgi:hypothetical protein
MKKLTKLTLLAAGASTFAAPYQASAEEYKMCVEDPSKGTASFEEVRCLIDRFGDESRDAHSLRLDFEDGSTTIGYREGTKDLYVVVLQPTGPQQRVRVGYVDENGDGSLDAFVREKFGQIGNTWKRYSAAMIKDGEASGFRLGPAGELHSVQSRPITDKHQKALQQKYNHQVAQILGYAITQDSMAYLDHSTEKLADVVEEAAKVLETDEFDKQIKELRDTIPTKSTAEEKPKWNL